MSEQNPHGKLTWRRQDTDPSCDELRIEVAWGAWPYRITVYADEAVVQRYVPDSPPRSQTIRRGQQSMEVLLAEARTAAEGWDAQVQAEASRAGLAVRL